MLNIFYFLSSFLYISCLSWSKILGFWLRVEIARLLLLMGFFSYKILVKRYTSLLYYLLVSGLRSGFIFSGILCKDIKYFLAVGFLIKVGMFPFLGWVLSVYINCGWFLFFLLGVMRKIPLIYLKGLRLKTHRFLLILLFDYTLVVLSGMLFKKSFNIKSYISIKSISSGCLLLILSINGGITKVWYLYIIKIFYSIVLFTVLYNIDANIMNSISFIQTILIMLAVPFSFGIFYKLYSAVVLRGDRKSVV